MNALREESGMTLVEVLIVSVLMLLVITATLTTFEQFHANVRTNERQNEAQDQTRRAMDLMARDLRNLASPTTNEPAAVDQNEPWDIIFQSEGKEKEADSLNAQNTVRVRYCLDSDKGDLYRQIQTWKTEAIPGMPPTPCGVAGGWNSTLIVAQDVVNGERPIFTYNAVDPRDITEVNAQLFVDTNPGKRPTEVDLQTTVFLRNQNKAPTAAFEWVAMPGGTLFLNASASTDPEEKSLTFEWWDATEDKLVGTGIVTSYAPPAFGPRDIYVIVRDATLETKSTTQTVCLPNPPEVTC